MTRSEVEVVIVGAGIAGLIAAHQLTAAGVDVAVLEARAQAGGRVRSVRDGAGQVVGDLGPTWVWPDVQPVAAAWLERLQLPMFAQHDDGLAIVELDAVRAPMRTQLPVQEGSMRLVGGTQALIDRLVAGLPPGAIVTGAPVTRMDAASERIAVSFGAGERITAARVVVATPPRIAAQLAWQPGLSPALAEALPATP